VQDFKRNKQDSRGFDEPIITEPEPIWYRKIKFLVPAKTVVQHALSVIWNLEPKYINK